MSKIIRLAASNIKRLTAVEITPDGTITTIGGKNGAGKSSVLDAIAYAAGGAKLIPDEPIRLGETKAEIEVTLDNHVIVRKFTRDRLTCDCVPGTEANLRNSLTPADHTPECASHRFGPIRSGLAVKTREGASYPSPQAVLDDLFGKLTFDPLAFFAMPEVEQEKVLRRLVGLDTTSLDQKRLEIYKQRADVNADIKQYEVRIADMPWYPDAPAEPVPLEAITAEIKAGQEKRQAVEDLRLLLNGHTTRMSDLEGRIQHRYTRIEELQREIAKLQEELGKFESEYQAAEATQGDLQKQLEQAEAVVPDFQVLESRLAEIDRTNHQVRQNKVKREAMKEQEGRIRSRDMFTREIEAIDVEKEKLLAAAQFPLPGLGFSDKGVTFGGIPLKQASTAEQIQISMAIGMSLNPRVKVLLIRNGNVLDEDSLKVISDLAAQHDYQVWMEWVTKSKDGVTVLIEDGHIA